MFSGNVRRIATVVTANDQATRQLKDAESAGDDAAQSFENTEKAVGGMRAAFVASAAVTGALAASVGALVMQHGRAEQTFSRMQELMGATDAEMSKLQDTAMAIGIDLPVAMGDASRAMEQLAFAGFSVQESMQAARGVANLAVSSTLTMKEAARDTASTLRMYNLAADETHQVTSALAATFASSTTNLADLTRTLNRAGSVASNTGITLAEVSGAAGVLADTGIRAARAGEGIRKMLQELAAPSGKAAKRMTELGLSTQDFLDSEGEFISLYNTLDVINNSMSDIQSASERMAAAQDLAGQTGQRALIPLLNNQEKLNEKIGDVFRSEIKASVGQLNKLNPDQIAAVSEALDMPNLDPSEVTPTEIVTRMDELAASGETTSEIAMRLQGALNISGDAATSLASDITDANTSVGEISQGIGGVSTASEIAASQMDTAAGSVKFLRASLDAMTFSIFTGAGPSIQWLNEEIAAGVNWVNNHEGALQALGAVLIPLTTTFAALTLALGANILATQILAASQGTLVGGFIGSIIGAGSLAGALGVLSGALYATAAGVWAVLAPVWPIIAAVGLVVGVFAALAAIMKFDVLGAGDAAAGVFDALGKGASWLGGHLQTLGAILWQLGRIAAIAFAAITLGPFAAALKFFDNPGKWLNAGKNAVMGLVAPFKSMFPGILLALIPGVGWLLAAAHLAPDAWKQRGYDMVKGLAEGIVPGPVLDAVSSVTDAASAYLPFSDAEKGGFSRLTDAGSAIPQTIAKGMAGEGGTVANALGSIAKQTPLGKVIGSFTGGLGTDGSNPSTSAASRTEIMIEVIQNITFEGGTDSPEADVAAATESATDDVLTELERKLKADLD